MISIIDLITKDFRSKGKHYKRQYLQMFGDQYHTLPY